jgi:hypothetical protein
MTGKFVINGGDHETAIFDSSVGILVTIDKLRIYYSCFNNPTHFAFCVIKTN